jgi:tripartite-type tricarboxylate transporter receptor subunit TctC
LWQAIYAPAGTPAFIVERLNKEINQLLSEPETVTLLDQLGVSPIGSSPQRLADWQKAELAKWREVITQANVRLE